MIRSDIQELCDRLGEAAISAFHPKQTLEKAVLQGGICDRSWSMVQNSSPKIRRDGWTAERQLGFLDVLAATRSITRAAAAAGMSRESAYRLCKRRDGALFAAAWKRIVEMPKRRD
jgi:hypothetical protein